MRELRTELPDHEERRAAINTIAIIAEKHGSEYDAPKFRYLELGVKDMEQWFQIMIDIAGSILS